MPPPDAQAKLFERVRRRYHNDARFHALVKSLDAITEDSDFTFEDIADAAIVVGLIQIARSLAGKRLPAD